MTQSPRPSDEPPVIITAAITGALVVPSQNAAIPIRPAEIIDSAVAASEAGAAIVHLHVRDPASGRPTGDLGLFREVADGIRERCMAIIEPTTGGGPGQSMEQRAEVVRQLRPELASFNAGSVNVSVFSVAEGPLADSFEPWEQEFLEGTRDYVFKNSFADMEMLTGIMAEAGSKPSFEAFEVGHLHNIKYLVDRGLIAEEPHIQFTLGMLGGIGAQTEHFMHMLSTSRALFGNAFSFCGTGIGYRAEFDMAAMSILHGGHVRVGLEDNVWSAPGVLARSNAELVEKAKALVTALDRRTATADEARSILGLRGRGREQDRSAGDGQLADVDRP
jgi:uncharacterized protein (DUF849 family)